ncbi:MAG TPA: F0F1 ATP synthase subunit B [Candidatus Kapabacteria bacterium]|nr:F0F1 ATP synthase subunit B [Candidatus Kapabacteria bacterium]
MDTLLDLPHGLMFWTIVNFGIFLFLVVKLGGKGIIKALNDREDAINKAIADAEEANREAKKLLSESKEKIDNAQQEVTLILAKGREQSEALLRNTTEAADKVKQQKIDEAIKEIERNKELAINQLRAEVADLVVNATEKIISVKLNKDQDLKLVEQYINQLPKN